MTFTEYRPDGWPPCPDCGEDELYSHLEWMGRTEKPSMAEYIAAGMTCYHCSWSNWRPNVTAQVRLKSIDI
jgi:hypothetical protein